MLTDFSFEADNTLKLFLKLAAEMNPGKPEDAGVIITRIKNITEVRHFFEGLKQPHQKNYYDRLHGITLHPAQVFLIEFFENSKLKISASSFIEISQLSR